MERRWVLVANIEQPVKLGIFLFVLGVVCATLLATVNSFTAPIIEEAKSAQLAQTLGDLKSNVTFKEITSDYSRLSGVRKVYGTYIGETLNGVIYLVNVSGYGGTIEVLIGINTDDDTLMGLKVLSQSETPGIGSKIVDFNFGVAGDSITANEFNMISGATVSSNAVKSALAIAKAQYNQDFN